MSDYEMGRERLGKIAMDLLDTIIEKYGNEATIGTVVVIAEIDRPSDNEPINGVEIGSSDARAWVVHGLCSVAADGQLLRLDLDDDDE